MGRSSMNSLKQALFPLALLALISMVTSKPKHLLVETKGSGSSDDYSYPPPPPPAYPQPYDYNNAKPEGGDYTYPKPPQVYDYKNKDYYYPPPPSYPVYRK